MTRFRHALSQEGNARVYGPGGPHLDADRAFQKWGGGGRRPSTSGARGPTITPPAAWFFAALPFQLLAQVCITHAIRKLGPQAGAESGWCAARV